MLNVEDADRTVAHAVAAVASIIIPVAGMFWGARYGKLIDPFGHEWGINQHLKDVTPAEEAAGAAQYFAGAKHRPDSTR